MREVRIYHPGDYIEGNVLSLNHKAAHHVANVLRMKVGSLLTLFNGNNNQEFIAEIISSSSKKLIVKILSLKKINRESPLAVELAVAVVKNEKMHFIIEKATELGVRSITPVLTDYSLRNKQAMGKRIIHWQAIANSACEQCRRNIIPKVKEIVSITEYLTSNFSELTLKLILDPSFTFRLQCLNSSSKEMSLILGPEGGFSNSELKLAVDYNFHGFNLGPRILRAETAAIAALSILQASLGDL